MTNLHDPRQEAQDDISKSFNTAIKFNGGFFKSAKQQKFLSKLIKEWGFDWWAMFSTDSAYGDRHERQEFLTSNFGITTQIQEGQGVFIHDYVTQWSQYGGRSRIMVMRGFIYDNTGIVEHWKIGVRGNLRTGTGPNPEKTKLLWKRDAEAPEPDWVAEQVEQQAKVEAESLPCPEGRCELVAKVLSKKMKDTAYGNVYKMIVEIEDEGKKLRLYGSVPSKIEEEVEVGSYVKFTATVKPSEDVGFGFFSRPSKASVVA